MWRPVYFNKSNFWIYVMYAYLFLFYNLFCIKHSWKKAWVCRMALLWPNSSPQVFLEHLFLQIQISYFYIKFYSQFPCSHIILIVCSLPLGTFAVFLSRICPKISCHHVTLDVSLIRWFAVGKLDFANGKHFYFTLNLHELTMMLRCTHTTRQKKWQRVNAMRAQRLFVYESALT